MKMRTIGIIVGVLTAGGFATVICSYIFTGEYASWTALLGLWIAMQAQLGGIWYCLGKISGQLSPKSKK